MLNRLSQTNHLGELVSSMQHNKRKASFETMTAESLSEFPILSNADLLDIGIGSYQLKQFHTTQNIGNLVESVTSKYAGTLDRCNYIPKE